MARTKGLKASVRSHNIDLTLVLWAGRLGMMIEWKEREKNFPVQAPGRCRNRAQARGIFRSYNKNIMLFPLFFFFFFGAKRIKGWKKRELTSEAKPAS
jgi:hypothetical protein